jgi:antitoxin component YwqK of YwqJK toxin-antitoxin module
MKNGVIHGYRKTFGMNGKLGDYEPFTNGQLDGAAKSHFYPSGKLQRIITYKNGKQHGTSAQYYENGILKLKTTYLNGRENGLETSYFENGKMESSMPVKSGSTVILMGHPETGTAECGLLG